MDDIEEKMFSHISFFEEINSKSEEKRLVNNVYELMCKDEQELSKLKEERDDVTFDYLSCYADDCDSLIFQIETLVGNLPCLHKDDHPFLDGFEELICKIQPGAASTGVIVKER